MTKSFNKIQDFLEHEYGKDSEEVKEVNKELYLKQVSRELILLRHNNKITQEELAKRMFLSADEINEIENSTSDEISVETMVSYVRGCNANITISIYKNPTKNPTIKERIDFHSKGLLKAFTDLRDICKDDFEMLFGALKTKVNFSIDLLSDISKTVVRVLESFQEHLEKDQEEKQQSHVTISFPGKEEKDPNNLVESTN